MTSPRKPVVRRLWALVRLAAVVAYEIVVANLQIAAAVLHPRRRNRPGMATMPLAARSDLAVTVLANIITMIPGTLTVDLTTDRSGLLLHFFEARDVEAQVAAIRRGLEPLVQEVFE